MPGLAYSEFAYGLMTSGTSGIPKLVLRRHADIVFGWNAYARAVLNMTEADRIYCTAPFCFGYGLGSGLLFPLLSGASAILPATTERLTKDLIDAQATLLFTQPAVIKEITTYLNPESLPSLRITVSAGETLPANVSEHWLMLFGHPILNGYGTTEVGHIFISQTIDRCVRGSVGSPVVGFKVEVVSETGAPCSPETSGVLRVAGPAPLSSYFLDEAASSNTFLDDWIVTADIATVSPTGDVFLLGRVWDFALLASGRTINLPQLDERLMGLPFIKDGYVVPHRSADSGTIISVSVIAALRDGLIPCEVLRNEIIECLALDTGIIEAGNIQFVDKI